MRQTVVGIFDQYAAAQHAAKILEDSGFDHDHVHVAASEDESAATDRGTRDEEGVIGRIRHFFSDLLEPDDTEEVGTYAEAVRRGGAVVKVDVDADEELDKARETLQQAGAVDIEEKVQEWRASGWTPSSDEPAGRPAESRARASDAQAEGAIPVVREELAVGKRRVGTGGVRVYSRVVEKPVEEAVDLRTERAEVKREAVDRPATQAELEGLRDKTIEVRETTEEPIVQKQARVVEEVSVGKKTDTRQQTVRDKVRNTEVEVEQLSGSQTRRAFDDYDSAFREDFDAQYAPSGARYEEYQPAYRYGYELAADPRYAGRKWDDIEADARRDWETAHPGSAWERFKASIRHAWERVTD